MPVRAIKTTRPPPQASQPQLLSRLILTIKAPVQKTMIAENTRLVVLTIDFVCDEPCFVKFIGPPSLTLISSRLATFMTDLSGPAWIWHLPAELLRATPQKATAFAAKRPYIQFVNTSA